jgi:murein L,D-transpeptidase YcbB/YkuD
MVFTGKLFKAALFAPISLLIIAASFAVSERAPVHCTDLVTTETQVDAALAMQIQERASLHLFYFGRAPSNQPADCAWTGEQMLGLRSALSRAADQGLDPDRYHLGTLEGPTSAMRDVAATAMAMRYAHDMLVGWIDEAELSDDIEIAHPTIDLPGRLARALAESGIAEWLASLQPADPQYAVLLKALVRYLAMARGGEPAPIPEAATTSESGPNPAVLLLKARLRAEGDLTVPDSSPQWNAATKKALGAFQRRHGLPPDGRLTRKTIDTLNVPINDRIGQIEANLEPRRYFGHVLPRSRIEVNAPAAMATFYQDWRPVLAMRAVVGDPRHPTPMLISAGVTAVILNPPWIIPASILHREILPKEEAHPGYLAGNNMYWAGDHQVQSPGPKNALGRIKFEFPNSFSVYLHDTPARSLFANYDRADSHGCVRLEKPMDLALAVLSRDGNWSRQRIEETIAQGTTVRIKVAYGPPVVMAYWTVFLDGDGQLAFRNDIYGRDARLIAAMHPARVEEPIAEAPNNENCSEEAQG